MNHKLSHIAFVQTIGPVFVILGHSLNGMPQQGFWYAFTKEWIYIFHMSLFFFISGYLFSFSKGFSMKRTYGEYIKNKCFRLMLPYIFWNLLFFMPKLLLNRYLPDDMELSAAYIIKVFLSPRLNVWGHTWFLFALFILFLFAPLFEKMRNAKHRFITWGIVTVSLAIWNLAPAQYVSGPFFAYDDLRRQALFFWIGLMIGSVPIQSLEAYAKKPCVYIGLPALASAWSIAYFVAANSPVATMMASISIILFLLTTPLVSAGPIKTLFERMCDRSFGIYIMHWPIMVAVRILLYQMLHLNEWAVVVCMILSGYILPNMIISALRKIKLGRLEKPAKYLLGV